jgi:hypothetical protein
MKLPTGTTSQVTFHTMVDKTSKLVFLNVGGEKICSFGITQIFTGRQKSKKDVATTAVNLHVAPILKFVQICEFKTRE